MIKEGIYYDLSSEEYHGDKNSISRSALMDFKRSPRKYWANHLNSERPEREVKPSWEFGTAFHTMILEPHLFDENYIMNPAPMLLKNVGREAYDLYKKTVDYIGSCGKQVLSHSDFEKLCEMRNSLLGCERAKKLIEGAVFESSYFWHDEHSGLMIKSRPDILHQNIYVDLKTIDDASPHNFQKEMAIYGYNLQAAMLKDGIEKLTGNKLSACINICVEKKYPYSIGIYIIDEAAIEQGQYEYKNLLLQMKNCQQENNFPDYQVQTIGLPKWAI